MFTLTEIFGLLLVHWFADFVLQTRKQAMEKSTKIISLLEHTFTYSIFFFILGLTFVDWIPLLMFTTTTFIIHTLTDFVTSRINSYL